jgi:lipoprotein-anchoring transpeptidase ErfK/SrfK
MLRWTFGLLALVIGCAVPLAEAVAQFYPPYGYPAQPPVYRAVPPLDIDDDDDDMPGNRPGDYRGPYQPGPYRAAPRVDPNGPRPYPPYANAEPYGVPRPPASIYRDEPPPAPYGYPSGAYRPQPGYPPYRYPQQGYSPQPGYGAPPAYDPAPTGSLPQQGAGTSPNYVAPPQSPPAAVGRGDQRYAALGPDYQPEEGDTKELPQHLRRQMVDYRTKEPAGTLIVDTPNTYLYLVMGNGRALRYGIGVGREGFTWAGEERISKMTEWPDWHPPAEMIERQPYLPRFMAGGPGNPLGARALYLGKSLYRVHGTNQPSTIGSFVSSGCIRLLNEDIEDLFSRVNVGTRVVVLGGAKPATASR